MLNLLQKTILSAQGLRFWDFSSEVLQGRLMRLVIENTKRQQEFFKIMNNVHVCHTFCTYWNKTTYSELHKAPHQIMQCFIQNLV